MNDSVNDAPLLVWNLSAWFSSCDSVFENRVDLLASYIFLALFLMDCSNYLYLFFLYRKSPLIIDDWLNWTYP